MVGGVVHCWIWEDGGGGSDWPHHGKRYSEDMILLISKKI
jgi:hypothetical protein